MDDNPNVASVPERRFSLVLLSGLVLSIVFAAFALCVCVLVAPQSPARVRLLPYTSKLTHPYFDQVWTLFAPNPPTDNLDWIVQARYVDPAGAQHEGPPVNATTQLIDHAKHDRLAPSRLIALPMAFHDQISDYMGTRGTITGAHLDDAAQQRAFQALNLQYAACFDQIQRFASAEAAAQYPGETITEVRAVLVQQEITPFSDRYQQTQQPWKQYWDSGWKTYTAGVGA
ncbi:hypothetical protein P3T37_005672 [Kitasatospora sp. MAA4]|uniref:DUF5819 family protein n=1 Tax=Kitasatospora sp. MAA4 TaxID=3035093 RepID=UPI0024753B36|nr:DUF5819 family protein [Kitasatospora sp. MAA4]MDH6136252.1 hypothetical protein [Kitasatospora sp. MAA4]